MVLHAIINSFLETTLGCLSEASQPGQLILTKPSDAETLLPNVEQDSLGTNSGHNGKPLKVKVVKLQMKC